MTIALTAAFTMVGRLLLAANLLAVAVAAIGADALAPDSNSASNEKLRQIMSRTQSQPVAAQAGNPAVLTAKTLTPERLQERANLLTSGELALTRRDVDTAMQAFDRAALILHAADTEIALVRTYMQGGEYRRALAFGAHTAGAHLDVVGGSALYVWLLHAGGQPVIAQRLLDEALSRAALAEASVATTQAVRPRVPTLLNRVQQQLRSGAPLASGSMLTPPTRLAPYGGSEGLPKTARVVGSGVLMPSGQEALVPLALVPRTGALWLRNGLGQLVTARVTQRLVAVGVARLHLSHALPVAQDLRVAERDAFPGSVGYAVEFVAAPDAAPAWPLLRGGFLGSALNGKGLPELGIDLPKGVHGGPVLDASGRLVGMALAGKPGMADRLVPASSWPQDLRKAPAASAAGASAVGAAPPRAPIDKIYEASLKTALQIIAIPKAAPTQRDLPQKTLTSHF